MGEKDIVQKSLDYSIKDGSAYSVMVGSGEAYIPAFAIKLGASNSEIGFLCSMPALIGSLVQPIAARFTEKIGYRKGIILFSVMGNALMWLPIIILPFLFNENRALWLILFFSLYALFNSFLGPAWASLMGDLVPESERGAYFGKRNKITGFAAFVSTIVAGYILGFFEHFFVYLGFVVIFSIASISRLISRYYLKKMHEPKYFPEKIPNEFLGFSMDKNFIRFIFFVSMINFSTNIAGPFFAVYMFKDLKMDYFTFGLLSAIVTLSQLVSMEYWGRLGDKFGNKKILTVTGFLVPSLPLLWLVSQNTFFLALIQILSGFSWGGFNLAAFNYILDSSNQKNRTRYIANYNFINNFGVFLGASIGGLLANYFERSSFLWFYGLQIIFLISGVLRLFVSLTILPGLKENRVKEIHEERFFFLKAVAVYPTQGVVNELVNGWKFGLDMFQKTIKPRNYNR